MTGMYNTALTIAKELITGMSSTKEISFKIKNSYPLPQLKNYANCY